MVKIILASKSEVRKRMLEKLNLDFEVVVSDADETPDLSKSFEEQLKEISMRKAKVVFEKTIDMGLRLIVAADQNIVFNNKMYGKPENLIVAESLIKQMRGSKDIYAYTGNALILADKDKIIKVINSCDKARIKMDNVSDKQVKEYINNSNPLTKCGWITIEDCEFIHIIDGKLSTAFGMTTEYMQDILTTLVNDNIKK